MIEATKKRSGPEETKRKILDAAEELFAKFGFNGVSVRKIQALAGVELALINYHFGPKQNLFEEVLGRRINELNDARMKKLDQIRIDAGGKSPSIEAIVEALILPVVERVRMQDKGWRNYTRLIANIGNSPIHSEFISTLVDHVSSHYISALRMALPNVAEEDVYWGYYYLLGAFIMTTAETGRLDLLSRGVCKSSDIETGCEKLVPFIAAGFKMLATRQL